MSASRASTSSARHTCHCGRSFARKEHLTRHQKTHDRPAHICNVCQRQFSRKELLRRHSALHDPSRTRVVVSCDACRANKTKCSGGTPCSLCTRRGTDCMFQGNHRQAKTTLTGRTSATLNGADGTNNDDDDENDNDDDISASAKSPGASIGHTGNSLRTGGTPIAPEWFRDVLIAPSNSVSSSSIQPSGSGMEAIHKLLLAEKSSLEADAEASDELQGWLCKCFETYVRCFHLRWPILNAPSFDAATTPLPLAASVCVIGTWLRDNTSQGERLCALRVHDHLLQRLLRNLTDPAFMSEGQAWPIELLEAVLLTLIFTLYRTDRNALSKATLLRSTFITILRDKGLFDTKVLADHLKSYFTGTYVPYNISMGEKFRRLLASTYQFDVYFAIAHRKPSILHHQEIGAVRMTTFGLWNAHGLDVFAERLLEEPKDRRDGAAATTNSSGSFIPSQLLVEDIIFGLCGLLQVIWVFTRLSPPRAKSKVAISSQRKLIIEVFDGWKHELDHISRLADASNINSDDTRNLFRAYRGEDDTTAASMERIKTLLQDGMLLYYYLKMTHYAGPSPSESTELVKQTIGYFLNTWRATRDIREALLCALQILTIAKSNKTSGTYVNPLIRHALTMGANLMIRMLVSGGICDCPTEQGHHTSETIPPSNTEGAELYCTNSPQLCARKLKFWIEEFDTAIQGQRLVTEEANDTPSS